ncbi:haloacid dehalogenase-like hydrolase [Micromonospora sp. M71_S20]|uniref:HAD family hydrolase n=1 Tax=Micromonospora sp. M71_S20 TaxID=592872 RepID=UPI000EB48D7B|nr:HAD hydrolase-like protein [Micromonospora sp. M71_S20]RLK22580.1 haloacid dehalogenase-like hydrolase [Micromonospora sp. M71_S20]
MQRLALFDLDNTLIDRQAAFREWAEEFVTDRGLDDKALTWLIATDAHMPGPRGPFFTAVRDEFALTQAAEDLWQQYRQRVPELVSCRAEDLDALRQLRSAGWRIGIVTNGRTDNQQGKIRRTRLDVLVDAALLENRCRCLLAALLLDRGATGEAAELVRRVRATGNDLVRRYAEQLAEEYELLS